jgi:HAD superfamily phosphoserine phosphatase-like hydrolase
MEISESRTVRLTAQNFLDSVLRLTPQVAAFDCDGTLWSGDAGETFFDWEIRTGLVSASIGNAMRTRYANYKAGKVSEDDMCGEMVTMHAGMTEAELLHAATQFMNNQFPGQVFPELRELIERLHKNGCEIWAVSSSNEWVIREGMKQFGIPENRILAAKAELESGMVTNRLIRVPSGPGKPKALREVVRKNIDVAFGNSRWDVEMLASVTHAFAINPNPDLEATARERGWTIYFPERTS